jgi:hypothetical protein
VTNCYSLADVNGVDYVGGLIGSVYYATGTVTNSYAAGVVTATGTIEGGLIAHNADTSYTNVTSSYWDTVVSTVATSAGGTGKNTAEMQTQATFVGWDFVNTWHLSAGQYPEIVGLAEGTAPPPVVPVTPASGATTSVTTLADATAASADAAAGNTVTALTTVTGTDGSPEGQDGGGVSGEDEDNIEDRAESGEGTQQTGDGARGGTGTTYCN